MMYLMSQMTMSNSHLLRAAYTSRVNMTFVIVYLELRLYVHVSSLSLMNLLSLSASIVLAYLTVIRIGGRWLWVIAVVNYRWTGS